MVHPLRALSSQDRLGYPAGTRSLATPGARRLSSPDSAVWKGKAATHRELHARFYAIEGMINGGRLSDATAILGAMNGEGRFPEEIGNPDSQLRADIQAQALRLLCLVPGMPKSILDAVSAPLCRHIRADGSVSFRIGEPHANVWCAQFTHQALDWLCYRCRDDCASPPHAHALI